MRRLALVTMLLVVAGRAETARIGLALSGGAALGLAHIGVLKVLEREGIAVSAISGNSMGSLVGGVYAAGYKAATLESMAVSADWNTLFSSSVSFGARYLPERRQAQRYVLQLRHRNLVPALAGGLVPLQNVELLLMRLLADVEYDSWFNFDSLPIPYRAVAVDLVTGRKVVFRDGRLVQAIRASIAIPGVFAPERIGEQQLVDGGVQQYLPVEPLLDFAPDVIIAVLTMKHNPETGISLIDVASRTIDVIGTEDLERQKSLADVIIEPNVDPFMHSDFRRAAELIAAGEAAAELALPRIRAALAGRRPEGKFHFLVVRKRPVVRLIRFDGLQVTRRQLVERELMTRVGSRLQFKQLIGDLERLFRTDLFDVVNYRLENESNDSVDVVLELEERAYGFYSLGVRYDNSDDVNLGLEFGQGNLFGTGAGVRAAVQLGNPDEIRLGLTGTRLFWLPVGYRLDAFGGRISRYHYDRDTLRSYYATDYLGSIIEAGYVLGRDAYFNVGVTGYRAGYGFPVGQSPMPRSVDWIAGPRFRLEANNYHDLEFPTRGASWQFEAFYITPLARSTQHALKLQFGADRTIPIGGQLLLRPGLQIGYSVGTLPWAERFRTGGDEFIGFVKNEFTTTHLTVARVGVDFRLANLLGQSDYPLYLQLIGNIGSFEPQWRLPAVLTTQEVFAMLRWGGGFGIRTNTPLGPLQLILGVGDVGKPAPYSGTRLNIYFAVGREFRYNR